MSEEPTSSDWAAETADRIEAAVDAVRRRTSVPLTKVARAIVYGLVAGVMAIVALVLLLIALVRALDVYLPGKVWAAHLVVGAVFTLVGLFLWGKRGARGRA